MTKILALQVFAAALITGAATTVAIRVDPSRALQAIAAAPVPHLILAARGRNVKALGIFIGALGEIRTPDPQIRSFILPLFSSH